jgi:stage III sporulation protein AB
MGQILLLGIIVSCCGLIGFIKAGYERERLKILTDFSECIANLQVQIGYGAVYLSEAIRNSVFASCHEDVTILLRAIARQVDHGAVDMEKVWRAELSRMRKDTALRHLKEEDVDLLLLFAKNLGQSDLETQNRNLQAQIRRIQNAIARVTPQIASRSKMYRSLGILSGLLIAILLV